LAFNCPIYWRGFRPIARFQFLIPRERNPNISTIRMLMIAATSLLVSGATGASAQAVSPCHAQIVADIDTALNRVSPQQRQAFNRDYWVSWLDGEVNQLVNRHASVDEAYDRTGEWPALLSTPRFKELQTWVCLEGALSNHPPVSPGKEAKKPDKEDKKKTGCDDPPNFTSFVEVEDGGTAADQAYAGTSYCMAYVSSRSTYPLACHLRGRIKTLYPGHEKDLFEGWPLADGEKCEAHIVCTKEERFPKQMKLYCP
jgi:hypothetical protein